MRAGKVHAVPGRRPPPLRRISRDMAGHAWNDPRMGATDETAQNLAYLLVPDSTRRHVLVTAEPTSAGTEKPVAPVLPTLAFDEEPTVREVLDAIQIIDPRTVLPLRLSELADGDLTLPADDVDGERLLMLVEFDAVMDEAPAGSAWYSVDAASAQSLNPPLIRPAVAAWLDERDHGWSPRRPVWSRPGWHAGASAWMVEQMSVAGLATTASPRVHYVWDMSVVLQAESDQGDA